MGATDDNDRIGGDLDDGSEDAALASSQRHGELLAGMVSNLVGGSWAVADQSTVSPDAPVVDLSFLGDGVCLTGSGVDAPAIAIASTAVESARPVVEALVEAERREAEARALAMTDHLTGLLNRWGWEVALAAEESRCQRHGRSAVVAVVDLDELKKVNDSDGHLGGDMLLRMAADALRRGCRKEDVVARIGGDEFAMIAVEDRPGDEEALAERLRTTLAQAGVAASVGSAARSQVGGLRSAFRHADGAMYADKLDRKRYIRQAEVPGL